MKLFIFGVLVLSSATLSIAQIANVIKISGEPLLIQKYDKVEGTPYFGGEQWVTGSVIDFHGRKHENISLRYNAYEDALEVKKNGDAIIVNKGSIVSFEFISIDQFGNQKLFLFKNGFSLSGAIDKFSYFRILYDNERLKVLEKVKTIQIKVTPASYGESDYEKFVSDNDTYLLINDRLEKTAINQKSLTNAFPLHKSLIKEFIKSKNLNLKNEDDLKRTCDYITSITSN